MSASPCSPSRVLRESRHHQAFVAHNLATREPAEARALFAHESRYYGTLMPELEGRRVLDLACGSGVHSLAWAERGARVLGVDFDHVLLGLARRRLEEGGRPGVRWSCGDATRLPLKDASFDVCYMNSLLEHVPRWRACLAEAVRVLRPGGLLVLYTANVNCPLQGEVRMIPLYPWLPGSVKRWLMAWIMEHRRDLVNYTDFPAVNWFTFPQLKRELASLGVEAHDRLDLIARQGRGGALGRLLRLAGRFPVLKWPYRIYARSIALYGVKGG